MSSVLYRLDGREVLKISKRNQAYDGVDRSAYGVMLDAYTPYGYEVRRRLTSVVFGPRRVEGYCQVADVESNACRLAVSEEIAVMDRAVADELRRIESRLSADDSDIFYLALQIENLGMRNNGVMLAQEGDIVVSNQKLGGRFGWVARACGERSGHHRRGSYTARY